jgi:ribosomal protein S1
MSGFSSDSDSFMAAFAASLCDVVATQITEFRAVLMVLEKKGFLSISEFQQAKESIPPEAVRQISQEIQAEVRKRIAAQLQRPPEAPVQ